MTWLTAVEFLPAQLAKVEIDHVLPAAAGAGHVPPVAAEEIDPVPPVEAGIGPVPLAAAEIGRVPLAAMASLYTSGLITAAFREQNVYIYFLKFFS